MWSETLSKWFLRNSHVLHWGRLLGRSPKSSNGLGHWGHVLSVSHTRYNITYVTPSMNRLDVVSCKLFSLNEIMSRFYSITQSAPLDPICLTKNTKYIHKHSYPVYPNESALHRHTVVNKRYSKGVAYTYMKCGNVDCGMSLFSGAGRGGHRGRVPLPLYVEALSGWSFSEKVGGAKCHVN